MLATRSNGLSIFLTIRGRLPPPRLLRRHPSSGKEGKERFSPPFQGGVARSDGVVRARTPPPRPLRGHPSHGEEARVRSTTARQHRTPRPCPHLSYNPLPSDDPAVARAVEVLVITTPMPLQIKGELEVMLDRKQIDIQIAKRIEDQVIACDQLSHNRGSVEPRLQPVEPQLTLF